jgi:hypothetical protein
MQPGRRRRQARFNSRPWYAAGHGATALLVEWPEAAHFSAMLTEWAPAKVNLFLHVLGRRADGYHLLDSLAVFAGIGDEVRAEAAEDLSLVVEGDYAAT